MPGGRPRKPTALKELQGNPGKRKLPEREPKLDVKAPRVPAVLKNEAKREWNRIVKELLAMRVLTVVDRAALTSYCLAWQAMIDAERDIQKHGRFIEKQASTSRGEIYVAGVVANPAVKQAQEARAQVKQLLTEFGLTPAARSKVKTIVEKPKAELVAFKPRARK